MWKAGQPSQMSPIELLIILFVIFVALPPPPLRLCSTCARALGIGAICPPHERYTLGYKVINIDSHRGVAQRELVRSFVGQVGCLHKCARVNRRIGSLFDRSEVLVCATYDRDKAIGVGFEKFGSRI